jgi:hypothetical protein
MTNDGRAFASQSIHERARLGMGCHLEVYGRHREISRYLFSANGAASLPAWGNVPGILTVSERALKALVRLGESSRQRRYQMDMIGHAADIGVHSGPDVGVRPRVAVFCAEYNMNDDFAKRLRPGGTIADKGSWMNRAFSAGLCACVVPGALPPGFYESRAVGAKRIHFTLELLRAQRFRRASNGARNAGLWVQT